MADDAVGYRSIRIDQRQVFRAGVNRRAACLLIVAIGIPAPQTITLPTLGYTYTLPAPAVQVSGNQSATLPTLDYNYALVAPSVANTSSPPEIVATTRATKIDARKIVRGGQSKAGIFTIALQQANGAVITLPTLDYQYALVIPYVISNPGLLYLSADDGKWPKVPAFVRAPNRSLFTILESGNQFIPLQTLSYTYSLVTPAVQVSGSQSVTLPTLSYIYSLVIPGVPQTIPLPTLSYSLSLGAVAVSSDPVVGPVTVIAWKRGWFNEEIKEIDDTFLISTPYEFSPYWMHFVDAIPASWAPFIQPYSQHVDDEMLEFDGI